MYLLVILPVKERETEKKVKQEQRMNRTVYHSGEKKMIKSIYIVRKIFSSERVILGITFAEYKKVRDKIKNKK